MTTRPAIKSEQEYQAALEAIEQLLEAEPGTPEGEEFAALAKLIEEYDDIHHQLNG
jgi:HTH-type transcriptional regulator/antitoxin HigA